MIAQHAVGLEEIVYPLSISEFLDNVYEKEFFFGKQTLSPFLESLPSIGYFEDFIRYSDLRFPTLSLVKEGKTTNYRTYTEIMDCGGINANYINKNSLPAHLDEGGTLVFNNVHLYHPYLREIKHLIWQSFGCKITGVNAYYTPKNAKGFNLHYDNHDVFVFQIYGSKHWKIYDSAKFLPLETEIPESPLDRGKPNFDHAIYSGDFLYIPRGFPHEAQTVADHSLHLTVGLRPVKRMNVLEEITKTLSTTPEMRRALSSSELKDPSQLKALFVQELQSIEESKLVNFVQTALQELDNTDMAFESKKEKAFSLSN